MFKPTAISLNQVSCRLCRLNKVSWPLRWRPRAFSDSSTLRLSSCLMKPLSTWSAITWSGCRARCSSAAQTDESTPPLTIIYLLQQRHSQNLYLEGPPTIKIEIHLYPLHSNRHHRSNGGCLEGKRENYQVCSVQYCAQQLCTVQCTHIWMDLTLLWIGFCLTGSISLCLDSFLYMYYCMHV